MLLTIASATACGSLTTADVDRLGHESTTATTPGLPAEAPAPTTTAPVEAVAGAELLGTLTPELVVTVPVDDRPITGLAYYQERLLVSVDGAPARLSLDPATGDTALDIGLVDTTGPGGIAVWQNLGFQATGEGSVVEFVDPTTLGSLDQLAVNEPVLGICALTEELATSDGSSLLRFRDPMSFTVVRSLEVTDPLVGAGLTELASANGQVWAVADAGTTIVRLDIITGQVIAWASTADLAAAGFDPGAVTGLAYRPASDTFFVAGSTQAIGEVRFVTSR